MSALTRTARARRMQAEPAEVDIVVGQTVYFAIVTGPGVTITDARLAGAQHHCEGKRKAA